MHVARTGEKRNLHRIGRTARKKATTRKAKMLGSFSVAVQLSSFQGLCSIKLVQLLLVRRRIDELESVWKEVVVVEMELLSQRLPGETRKLPKRVMTVYV
jgi:hypothetical protein